MDPAKEAKSKLVWYFRMLAQKAGIGWTGDNECEVESIVDEILRAASTETGEKILAIQEQIEALQDQLAKIEAAVKSNAE
jgi:hypothetical protein